MYQAASKGFTNATDFADYLVKHGIPFRSAHEITGRLVLHCIGKNVGIEDLSLSELQEICGPDCPLKADIYDAISLKTCVEGRKLTGGPAPETVSAAILRAKEFLRSTKI